MELKEIAPYLAHGLKWDLQGLKQFTMSGLTETTLYTEEGTVLNWRKQKDLPQALFPILRPLSDLAKPCLECGKIPIIELLKAKYPDRPIIGRYSEIEISKSGYPSAWYKYSAPHEIKVNTSFFFDCEYWVVQWLYEHHFWLGDQNRFGQDIIDINTISK